MLKTVFASMIAVAATVFLAVGASAGATAQHMSLNMPEQCFAGKGGSTICVTSTGEQTIVQTPSGNFSAEFNGTDSFVVTYNGAVVATGTDSIHAHVLYASDFTVITEAGTHITSSSTSGGTTCTFSGDLHVTDIDLVTGTAHIQYNNVSFVCV